jgi:superfamily I DNA and/or RNA helicase
LICAADQLTILTPYLGQLAEIRRHLAKSNMAAHLNDRDMGDLARANLTESVQTAADAQVVKVATVDNFQGEEADIIVISLVRSNKHGDIGFLSGRV